MLCPQCGSTQADDLRFCKSCGANLHALRRVLATRDQDDKFDWSKTWVAEMFMSSEEAVKRSAHIEKIKGKTPETKRRNEIKAGVINASLGLGLMMVLFVLMEGIVRSGRVSDAATEILSRIWIVGLIPFMIGIALIINGVFISKRGESEPISIEEGKEKPEPLQAPHDQYLPPADTNDLFPAAGYSVTDETTKHLKQPR